MNTCTDYDPSSHIVLDIPSYEWNRISIISDNASMSLDSDSVKKIINPPKSKIWL